VTVKTPRSLSISEARARLPELARFLSVAPDGVVLIEHRDRAERLALITERRLRYLESIAEASRVREGGSFQLAGSMTSDLDDEELDKALMAVKREGEARAQTKSEEL
jgi:3-methyladenine DNA glycosylase/8-oxoguanine DNA glycosylase